MGWTPSKDPTLQRQKSTVLWETIGSIYQRAIPLAPVPRYEKKFKLDPHYILERGSAPTGTKVNKSNLPQRLQELPLGLTEIDLIDKIINRSYDRVIVVEGPRGAGKTSLLNYVETALANSFMRNRPLFLFLDGLKILEHDGIDEYTNLLKNELQRLKKYASASWHSPLNEAINYLAEHETDSAVRDSLALLCDLLSPAQKKRLVIVFDNLDHLSPSIVGGALELAKVIYVETKCACIVSLRPNCLHRANKQGDARAFFQHRVTVSAPRVSSWIRLLGARLTKQIENLPKEDQNTITLYGEVRTVDDISKGVDRLVTLLSGRRKEDDILGLLESVSADDTRHLTILMSRLLKSRHLPTAWLLDGGEIPKFHPIPALMESCFQLYENNKYIPNLLQITHTKGNYEYILHFRILCFLGHDTVDSNTLFNWLALLGYPFDVCMTALAVQQSALLIRGTTEPITSVNQIPDEYSLTQAGHHYKNHLLSNIDYLTCAVTDIELEHTEIKIDNERKKTDRIAEIPFSLCLLSLMEYAKEVAKREASQITRLTKCDSGPELRKVADVLRNGGLFIDCLTSAFKQSEAQASNTRFEVIYDVFQQLSADISKLESDSVRLKKRLDEIMNRSRRTKNTRYSTENIVIEGVGFNILFETKEDDVFVESRIELNDTKLGAFYNIHGSLPFGQYAHSGIQGLDSAINNGNNQPQSVQIHEGIIEENTEFTADEFCIETVVGKKESFNRTAFLAIDQKKGKIKLRLATINNEKYESLTIGTVSDPKILRDYSKKQIKDVEAAFAENILQQDYIDANGSALANKILSREGTNFLSSFYHLIDKLIIFVDNKNLVIPWEWIRPPDNIKDPSLPTLPCAGEMFTVSRWPYSKIDGVFLADLSRSPLKISPYATFGNSQQSCGSAEDIGSYRELCAKFKQYNTIHLIGHLVNANPESSDEPKLSIKSQSGDWLLRQEEIVSFQFDGTGKTLILSACEVGALSSDINLAGQISKINKCVVWTPMVEIQESHTKIIDQEIASFANDFTNDVDDFFLHLKNLEQLGKLYVRYGL